MTSLEIMLLGGFRARMRSGDELVPRSKKAALLLARLALRVGEVHTRETLIGLLWSDRAEAQARASLRQELTLLRKMMAACPPALAIDGERLSLDPAAVEVDVRAFEQLAASESTRDLDRAATLYRGPLLEGFAVRDAACEEWLAAERERLRDLFLGVLDRILARQLQEGALHRAITTAQTLLAHDPLREDAHRTLMVLHAQQGRRSLALKQYQACSDLIRRELGVDPEPETQRLYLEIRDRGGAGDRPASAATSADADVIRRAKKEPGAGGRTLVAPLAARRQAQAFEERPGIAVLPFANISGDSEQDYFADGLTEDIITDLSRVSGLFVVARNSVFTFKGQAIEVRDAARALGVRYVLEGSVRKAAGRVRITAQLVDGRTGGHLWAERYDRSLDDIFTLQDEISQSIVRALKVRLPPEELATIVKRPTTNPEAYQYYLRGRAYFLQSGWGRRALSVARQMFMKAAEIDPAYARAFAGVANCDSTLLCMGDPAVPFEDILANSTRALELEPDLAEAHAAKGLALYMAGRHVEANAALDEAVRLGPTLFEAHFFAGRNSRAQGRYAQAAALFERAAELQPDDFRALGLAVNAYRSLGRRDEVESAAKRCLERVDAEIAVHPDNAAALAFGAAMLAELGETSRAEVWLERAAKIESIDSITRYNLAAAYAMLGRFDAALERLQQVFSDPPFSRRSHVEWLKHDSSFERLRGHPEFEALLQRLDAETKLPPGGQHRPAIAVLPFENLSDDPQQQYFSDGISEDVITDLSRFRSLHVVARSTSFRHRGQHADVKRIGREIGVDYVVLGSLRREGDRIQLTARLVDVASENQLWAERFDRDEYDVFAAADMLVRTVVGTLAGRVHAAGSELAKRKPPASLAAYDCVLRAQTLAKRIGDPQAEGEMRQLYEKAVELDPGYGRALAGLAFERFRAWFRGTAEADATLEHAVELASRAVALDPNDSVCQETLGWVLLHRKSFDLAEHYYRRALELNPNSPDELAATGSLYGFLGRPEEGIEWFEQAKRIDPYFDPSWYWHLLGTTYFNARRYDDAIAAFNRSASRPLWAEAYLAACHALSGRPDQAMAIAGEIARRSPEFSGAGFAAKEPYKLEADREHLLTGLAKAGMLGGVSKAATSDYARGEAVRSADGSPALAVLPFDNLSGDPEEQYFADGVVEEVTAALSRVRSFSVIARSSTLRYRDGPVEPARVGRELGVRYLLQGSVRTSGDRLRITVQLIEAAAGASIWADRYDGRREDVFDLQDRITERTVGAIEPTIRSHEIERARRKRPESLEAYDCVMRALPQLWARTPGASAEALRLSSEAVRLDPNYALANALAAWCHALQFGNGWSSAPEQSCADGLRLAEAALRLDANDPRVLTMVGAAETLLASDLAAAATHIETALALDPNSAWAWIRSGHLHVYRGEPETALEHFERAASLSPFDPLNFNRFVGIAFAHFTAGRYQEAIAWAEKACVERPGLPWGCRVLAAAHAQLGQDNQAEAAARTMLSQSPQLSLAGIMATMPFRQDDVRARLAEGLRKAGVPESPAPVAAADRVPAIAVLPFENLSDDPDREYLADGIVDEITAALSRVRSFFVIARSSTLVYRNRAVDAARVGRELGVRYLLQGSVRTAGDRIRITVTLIEAASGASIWADRYEGRREDVFDLQDRITERVVGALEPTIRAAEIERARRKRPDNLEAYDYVMRALPHVWALTREASAEALRLSTEAIRLDAAFARANALAAWCHGWQVGNGWSSAPEEARAEGMRLAAAALRLGADDPGVLTKVGAAEMLLTGDLDAAGIHIGKALALDPNSAWAWIRSGYLHAYRCEPETALEHFERAARLSPFDPLNFNRYIGIALAHFVAARYREAAESAEKGRIERPHLPWAHRVLAAAYAQLGRDDQAQAAAQAALAQNPSLSVPEIMATMPFRQDEVRGRFADALRKAGIPDIGEPTPVPRARDNRIAVAVLPFENLSGDSEQQYFSDGIAAAVIAELSRWRQLMVLSRNQSFRYRDRPVDVTRVGRELGVRYVVEGSIHKAGDRIRVMAQLTDAASGSHLWAEQYDRHIQELFAVQDEVVQTIVGTLGGRVQAAGAELAKGRPPASLAAYDCVLRGLALPWGDPQADAEARRLYERAVELDPGYGLAHALLALMIYAEWGVDPKVSDAALDRAFELAKKAVELDENESMCQAVLGWLHLMRRSFELAEQYHRRAIEMNPSNPQHLADMGSLLVYLGRPEEGLEWLNRARRIDPYFGPSWYWYQLGFACMTARRYDEAIQAFERASTMSYWVRAYVAACHAQAGRIAEAEEQAAEALRLRPDFSATWNASKEPFKHRRDQEHLFDSLRKAGIPAIAPARGGSSDGRPSVAVLPFDNLSGDPGEQLFSDGITEDIITELSRFRRLLVVARHSSFHYRDGSGDVSRIGRELQVQYLVEGSIRKGGGRIRIAAQLIETASGSHLWAEHYDRSLDDLFDLQDEVARMIASALAGRIEVEDLAKAKRKPPESMTAYDYWLRGKKCLDLWTPEANAEARRLFAKAIESDTEYARGYAGLAFTYEWAAYYSAWDAEGSSSHENARRYAERAVALDDTDHLPHVVLGWVHHQLGEFEQAQQQFARAAAINPNDADTMMNKAMVLALEGRPGEAIEIAQFAVRLNPRHPDWYLAFLGACFFRDDRYADAAAIWERAPDAVPEIRACLAAACILAGRPQDARRHMEEFLRRFALHWTGQPGVRAFVSTEFAFAEENDVDRFANALRAAGMPE
jgi:TolB-like protein/Tfp pilus assembly protein PilF